METDVKQRPDACRPELEGLMKEVYGYDCFRELEIYRDLMQNKDTQQVSQGILMEHVVRLAEQAYEGKADVGNILLTAPTGAGKSLLFQLPGIYLGRRYGLLTLVISPLKALVTDQVESLHDLGYTRVAFASSDLSPEQKREAYRKVQASEVDLFYLSPELLLSYDVRHFIGQRRIGLVVVDEAHTVTTWGKEFRVDYWFLGRYLRGLKEQLGYAFPLFALTATAVWNPGGRNDMVHDTVHSLHMEPCSLYVGTVRRHNISFDICRLAVGEETYDKAKQRAISSRIDDYLNGHKTLLYYPFAATIDQRVKSWVRPEQWTLVASYYGKKDKVQKAAIVDAFKEGSKRLIVATKAFGMGIDIRDIDRVYHVAPSGTFVDYIQEIGRAARDASVKGLSATDFHEKDFYYMKRLHQAGGLTQDQLRLMLRQLLKLYDMKGRKERMMLSISDFEFAVKLPRCKNKLEYESALAQFVKTALLWLEEDLNRRFDEPVMQVSPCGLLPRGYVQDKAGTTFSTTYADYLKPVNGTADVYLVELERLWEERFPDMGYKDFKQKLAGGTLCEGSRAVAVAKHQVMLRMDADGLRKRLDALFAALGRFLGDKLRSNKGRFDESQLRALFADFDMDVRSARRFLGSLLESRVEEGRSLSYISSAKKKDSNELTFTVTRGFDVLLGRYQKLFATHIQGRCGGKLTFFCTPFSDLNMLLNLLAMFGGLSFCVEGGGTTCVEVCLKQVPRIEEWMASGDYCNRVLEQNEQLFEEQIELFRLFFGNGRLTDEQRWDFVEDYFTGMSVDDLRRKYGEG